DQFILLFDAVAVPANGATAVAAFKVPAGSTVRLDYGWRGKAFENGICWSNRTTLPALTAGTTNCYAEAHWHLAPPLNRRHSGARRGMMGWRLTQVHPVELHAWWPLVRPGLERVRKRAGASWLCEDIYSAVRTGGATMHVGYIDQLYAGVLVLTVNAD